MKSLTVHFSSALAERAGRERAKTPCGAAFNWFSYRIEVAFRSWEDHYTIYSRATGEHLASFMDTGHSVEELFVADGYTLTAHHAESQVAVAA